MIATLVLLAAACSPVSSRPVDLPPAVYDIPDQLVMGTDVLCTRTGTKASCIAVEPYSGGYEAPPGEYTQLDGGGGQLCGLTTAGEAQCWYDDGDFSPPEPGPFVALGSGSFRSCGLRPDGSVTCWSWPDAQTPSERPGPYTAVAGATKVTCGLGPTGTIECWDAWSHDTEPPTTPGWVSMEGYGAWVCALNTEGRLACWGTTRGGNVPQTSPTDVGFRDVAIMVVGACALRADREVTCWGADDAGTFDVPPGPFTEIAGGNRSVCGLRPSGIISCWGCIEDASCPADFGVVGGELARLP